MTSKLTRERLQEIAEDGFLKHGESKELARIALAAMDSEPVAWTWHYREQWHVTNDERRAEFVAKDGDVAVLPLYRHAQPAPEHPEVLPCSVLLEPGLRFGKGIKTSTMLAALARRAVHESDMAALSPEERAEFEAGIEDFKALIAQPAPVVPTLYSEEVNEAAWALNDMLTKYGPLNGEQFNNLKGCFYTALKVAMLSSSKQPAPVVPDFKKLARELVDNLVDCGGLDEGVKEKYLEWAEKTCRAAMLAAAPHDTPALNSVQSVVTVPDKWIPVSEQKPGCWCRTCRPVFLNDMRFVVCPDCGNKRCPRANDHRNACTGSNEPGQEGSAYPAAPQEVKGE